MLKRLLVLPLLALGSLGASEQASIGIGGLYSSSKATNANVKDSGIYLNFRGDEISENYRTKIGAELEYGFGISKTSGSLFSYLDKFGSENKFEYWDFLIRPGFNIFTKEVPCCPKSVAWASRSKIVRTFIIFTFIVAIFKNFLNIYGC